MTTMEFVASGTMKVQFQGQEYLIVKDPGDCDGPVCTLEQYENGACSFAHAYSVGDGVVMRFQEKIGTFADVERLEDAKAPAQGLDAFANILDGIFAGGWRKPKA